MRPTTGPVKRDHVHVGVRDRRLAAAWYRRVLRLRIAYDYTRHGAPNGPLVLSGDNSNTHLALFVDRTAAKRKRTHIGTLAFRVAGPDFLRFLGRLARLELPGPTGCSVTPADAVDHGNSYSVYAADPDGNRVEITTYDHAAVERALKR